MKRRAGSFDPDGRTQATLHRMIRDEPARISFVTLFDDGGVVRTTCPGTGRMPSLPNYRVTEIRGAEASQLLAAHEEQVAAFARDRRVNARAATVAEVTAASDAAERPLMRQIGHDMYAMLLPFAPAVLFFAGGLVTGTMGRPWFRWGSALLPRLTPSSSGWSPARCGTR